MTMLFVIIGHFITYLVTLCARRREIWPNRWAGLLLGFCLCGLLTLQLHSLVIPQILTTISETQSVVIAWKNPLWTLLELVNGLQTSFAGSIVATGALLVFGVGVLSFVRTKPVVIQLLVLPPVIGAVVVMAMGHHMWPRFFFFTFGLGALVVVRGTMQLGHYMTQLLNMRSTKTVPIGTALCAVMIFLSALSVPAVYGPKQDYQAALDFVEARKAPGDAVVTVGLASFPYKSFYNVDWDPVESLDTFRAIRSRARRTWLVYTIPPQLESVHPEIMVSIERDFKVVKRFYGTLRGGTIFVCRSDILPVLATDGLSPVQDS